MQSKTTSMSQIKNHDILRPFALKYRAKPGYFAAYNFACHAGLEKIEALGSGRSASDVRGPEGRGDAALAAVAVPAWRCLDVRGYVCG